MNYNDYELIYMIKEDEKAFNVLLNKYEPIFRKLSYSFANNYKYKGIDPEDLMQQCRIVFCYVLDKFDYNRDILFYTYLLFCLRRMVFNNHRRYQSIPDCYNYMDIDNYDNLDFFVSDYNVSEFYDDYDFSNKIIMFKNDLSSLDGQIFELRYNGFSYKDIASLLEINVKKVDNTLLKIRKKLEKSLLFSWLYDIMSMIGGL